MKPHLKEVGCITIHLPLKWPAGNNHPLNNLLHFGKYLFHLRPRRFNFIIDFNLCSFSDLKQCAVSLGSKFKSLVPSGNVWCETKVPLRKRILNLCYLSSNECNMSGHWIWRPCIWINYATSIKLWGKMQLFLR